MVDAIEERLKSPPECDQEEELSQDLFSEASTLVYLSCRHSIAYRCFVS